MNFQKRRQLAWFSSSLLLGAAAIGYFLLLFPQLLRAQAVPQVPDAPLAGELIIMFDSEGQTVLYGDTAVLTLNITNTSSSQISDITVTPRDVSFTDCVRAVGQVPDLNVGADTAVTCSSPNLFEDVEVVFDVTAVVDNSYTTNGVAYTVLDSTGGLALTIAPEAQSIPRNSAATLTVTLRNTDSTTATNLTLSAPDFPGCQKDEGSLPDLASGENYQYQCQTPLLNTDSTYTLTALATLNNLAVTAVDHTTINADSQVAIAVSPSNVITAANSLVTFTVTVTNNLITDTLTNVTVSTASAAANRPSGITTDCARTLADLAPGETTTYSCQGTAVSDEPNQRFTLTGYTTAAYADGDAHYHIEQANAYIGPAYTFLPVAMSNYPPYTYPDLAIKSLDVSQISNDTYHVNIVVANQSTEDVAVGNNFFVNAYLTSNLAHPILVCSMQGQWFAAGQTRTCSGQITLPTGTHTVRAWADPYNTVTEEYETNNTRDLEVTHE